MLGDLARRQGVFDPSPNDPYRAHPSASHRKLAEPPWINPDAAMVYTYPIHVKSTPSDTR